MKLTATVQVSVDGVMQANGPSARDRALGMERDGWAFGKFGEDGLAFITELYQRADAFLFGRQTFELFAPYWGAMELGDNPIADAMNTKPKYVASSTLTEPEWADTTVLDSDLADAVRGLKARPGGELQVHGSGALIRWLLAEELVDELNLLIVPVVVGQGERLFPADGPDIALELLQSRAFAKGVTLQVYRTAGRPEYVHAA